MPQALERVDKVSSGDIGLLEDAAEGANLEFGVKGHDAASRTFSSHFFEDHVAASLTDGDEAEAFEGTNRFSAGNARQSRHS